MAGSLPVSPASAERCPPAEQPATAMKSRSPPNLSTLARAHAIAVLTSVMWAGQRLCGETRYSADRHTHPISANWDISA